MYRSPHTGLSPDDPFMLFALNSNKFLKRLIGRSRSHADSHVSTGHSDQWKFRRRRTYMPQCTRSGVSCDHVPMCATVPASRRL
jgi:hypothetical protein